MHLSKHYDKKAAGCFCCLGMFLIFGYIDATNLSQVKGFAPEKLGGLTAVKRSLFYSCLLEEIRSAGGYASNTDETISFSRILSLVTAVSVRIDRKRLSLPAWGKYHPRSQESLDKALPKPQSDTSL